MRIFILFSLLLALLLSCDSDPFKSEHETCETILFGTNSTAAKNSPTLTVASEYRFVTEQSGEENSLRSPVQASPAFDPYDSTRLAYYIEYVDDVIQGTFTSVGIMMPTDGPANQPIGGYNFLFAYDASILTFQGATTGSLLDSCEWEYFTYRYGADGNCEGGCPSGLVRVVGIAETNNGPNHPISGCTNGPGKESLAHISFLVSNDREYECKYVPIRFFWIECGDNTVSNEAGDTLYIARSVRNFPGDGENLISLYPDAVFPTYNGPVNCNPNNDTDIIPRIDFINGGIDIKCADSINARGDINLDGIPYGIKDANMLALYFIQDTTALVYLPGVGYEGSIAASDVNADGIPLGVADLVYLIRIINGDALPYPKPLADPDGAEVHLTVDNSGTYSFDADMGAVWLVFEGAVHPELLADQMDLNYQYNTVNTRVLVWSIDGNSFTGEFLRTNAKLLSIETALASGAPVDILVAPDDFALEGADPNPFTDQTTISFALPTQIDCKIWIYSINPCEIVAAFTQTLAAGQHSINWDASDEPPGEYVCRIQVGDVIKSINMTKVE